MESTTSTKKQTSYFAWLLLLVSFFPLYFGGYPLAKQLALDTMGVESTGTVIEVQGAPRSYLPIVQFTAEDGTQYTFKSFYGSNNIVYAVGEEVQMRYLAAYPRIAEVTLSGRINYLSNLGSCCLGVFLLMGGAVDLRNKPLTLDLRKRK